MTTAIIVQARMGSSRLPGKVLLDLAGKPVLQHVLERCDRVPGADLVVCAIADEPNNARLVETAKASGAEVFIGPERDVLARYHGAAHASGADVIMRVTSDCPLVDPEVCGEVIRLRASADVDYASNLMPRSYPKGLDCEVFTLDLLDRAAAAATEAFDREHVTQWMVRAADVSKANVSSGDTTLARQRWTLDYAEDLEFLRQVCAFVPSSKASLREILAVLAQHPELIAINAGFTEPQPQHQSKDATVHE